MHKGPWVVVALAVWALTAAAAESGMVNIRSAHGVGTTVERLVNALESKGLTVFARIDHAAGAAKAGQSLLPTQVVIFGNPKVGTPLMKCARTVGIDLPQKALVWQDDAGVVWLTYNAPAYLNARHGLDGCDQVLVKVEKVLASFAAAATQP